MARVQSPGVMLAADPGCGICGGTGYRGRTVCGCCYRRVFRDCLTAYQEAVIRLAECGEQPVLELVRGGITASVKRAEYVADFDSVAHHALAHEIGRAHV